MSAEAVVMAFFGCLVLAFTLGWRIAEYRYRAGHIRGDIVKSLLERAYAGEHPDRLFVEMYLRREPKR